VATTVGLTIIAVTDSVADSMACIVVAVEVSISHLIVISAEA